MHISWVLKIKWTFFNQQLSKSVLKIDTKHRLLANVVTCYMSLEQQGSAGDKEPHERILELWNNRVRVI